MKKFVGVKYCGDLMLLLYLPVAVLLCGCGGEEPENWGDAAGGQGAFVETEDSDRIEQVESEGNLFFRDMLFEEEPWRDNTLDDYTAALHLPLAPQRPEGELGGMWEYALGDTCGAVYKKHVLGSAEDSWEELKIATYQGDENSVRLAFQENVVNQAWGMGSIIGSDHFMVLDMEVSEDSQWKYRLFEIDADQQIVRTVNLEFLAGDGEEAPDEIIVDREGYIHFTTSYWNYVTEEGPTEHRNYYFIANSDGELLAKYDYTGATLRLVALYDGRVALWSQSVDSEGQKIGCRLECADIVTGKMAALVELDRNAPKVFLNGAYFTLWDEKTLLYADSKGLHFADLSGNSTEDVYIWVNHGISFSELEQLRVLEDGCISLIYSDSQRDGNLLFLKPAQEEVEVQQIVLAVSSYHRDVYYPAVVEFNKKYPTYHIEIKTDYDETRLLTELTAGKGPVLVETNSYGFEDYEKLWTPLEGLFDGEQWEDVLIPQAMELGKIDGTLYGVVSSFELKTVVIAENEPTDWDYEGFLDGIESDSFIEAICNGQNYVWSFMYNFLIHGMEDNYLLDAESGATYFDSDGFRRALRLGMAYCDANVYVEAGTPLLEEGKVFCNEIRITRPELVDLYRICYGKDANYIGYPSKDGSGHYVASDYLLTIRATASDEEKKIAGAFLQMLLSRDEQLEEAQDSSFCLSVRRDVLEEQIGQVNEQSMPFVSGFNQITLGEDYDREYDAWLLYKLLGNARPERHLPKELNTILREEVEEYMAGVITEDVLIERLTNRVGIYLAERNYTDTR